MRTESFGFMSFGHQACIVRGNIPRTALNRGAARRPVRSRPLQSLADSLPESASDNRSCAMKRSRPVSGQCRQPRSEIRSAISRKQSNSTGRCCRPAGRRNRQIPAWIAFSAAVREPTAASSTATFTVVLKPMSFRCRTRILFVSGRGQMDVRDRNPPRHPMAFGWVQWSGGVLPGCR